MNASAPGKEVLEAFQGEFQRLLKCGDSLAREIEVSFRPCPPNPVRDSRTFMMGSPDTDADALYDEKPQIQKTVAPFEMANAPTTNGQYRLYDPADRREAAFDRDLKSYSWQDDSPVTYVSWYDAWCFAKWCRVRLPTEVEWEYACRAGTATHYWWGDKIRKAKCTVSATRTTPACEDHANPWQLMEMSGNVYEWCDTWYHDKTVTAADRANVGIYRVLRGGSFNSTPNHLRSASRYNVTPELNDYNVSFRICRTI